MDKSHRRTIHTVADLRAYASEHGLKSERVTLDVARFYHDFEALFERILPQFENLHIRAGLTFARASDEEPGIVALAYETQGPAQPFDEMGVLILTDAVETRRAYVSFIFHER